MEARFRFVSVAVFLTSLSLLAYEILLTRLFSLIQWQSLASIVISLALLGFGASGTALTIFRSRWQASFLAHFQACLLLFPASLTLGTIILCRIPFNPFELGIDQRQWIYLVLYLGCTAIPFFFGATIIAMALSCFPVARIYFLNLCGGAAGAGLAVLLSFWLHPLSILALVSALSLTAASLFSLHWQWPARWTVCLLSLLLAVGFPLASQKFHLAQPSPYKPLSRALLLPQARVLAERYSPLGVVQVIEANGLHYSGDLSLVCPYPVPIQKAIFCDADSMSPVIPFSGSLEEIRYLDYLPSSLPYQLQPVGSLNRVLLVGAGGGEGILKALRNGASVIEAVEINDRVIEIMKGILAPFSGRIFHHPRVKIVNTEVRGYLASHRRRYDLIDLSLVDSYAAAASGARALNESYLYTRESIQEFIEHLTENGLLAITRWNETPPRQNLKLLNLCLDALEKTGASEPSRHIFYLRSMRVSTLVVSRFPLTADQIRRGKSFAARLLFDLIHYPGMKPEEANRYIKAAPPLHDQGARMLLSAGKEAFLHQYPFDLSLPTDDRPFFYNSFRWRSLPFLRAAGPQRIPFSEWGYFPLTVCLLLAILASFVLIPLPLFFSSFREARLRPAQFLYFSFLGIAFFFVEMPLVQKFTLFLHHPTYSLSVILSSLLLFSGLGSYLSDRLLPPGKRILASCLLIGLLLLAFLQGWNPALAKAETLPDSLKILLALLALAPLGFFMGIPFPQGLSLIKEVSPSLVPWAWAVNGFFSVISVISAHLLSIPWGFSGVLRLAAGFYLLAGILSLWLVPRKKKPS